ncbi:hypothetical protein EVG20_g9387 [Dentipellis fragilis]|uniref:Uncharacterized protein n=1 Tax=Dentipellis fragilis TaxID=205917 RepID=A0A4Y9Y366_9AGAM|nr:hypothetical protein EVG20_g9387 [Dentipellis fragilis]
MLAHSPFNPLAMQQSSREHAGIQRGMRTIENQEPGRQMHEQERVQRDHRASLNTPIPTTPSCALSAGRLRAQ